jgi:hypothetical protein
MNRTTHRVFRVPEGGIAVSNAAVNPILGGLPQITAPRGEQVGWLDIYHQRSGRTFCRLVVSDLRGQTIVTSHDDSESPGQRTPPGLPELGQIFRAT